MSAPQGSTGRRLSTDELIALVQATKTRVLDASRDLKTVTAELRRRLDEEDLVLDDEELLP